MTAVLLEMRGISKRFAGVEALRAVDLDLGAGEVHVVAGENGAGKPTLMKVLAGAHQPDAGEIRLGGNAVRFATPRDALAAGIAVVHQEGSLAPHLTVAENVALGREVGFFPDRAAERVRTRQLLDEVGATHVDPDAHVGELGVAARQLVEIARALGLGGKILVLDEPTASLSENEVPRLFEVVRRLRERGTGVFYISHRLEEFAQIGDRVTVLRGGRNVWSAPVESASPAAVVEQMAGRAEAEWSRARGSRENSAGARPSPRPSPNRQAHSGSGGLVPSSAATHRRASPLPACGERQGEGKRVPGSAARAPLLEVTGLSAGPLEDVSLVVGRGEIVGVAGLVGSGRSSLCRALFGAMPLRSGTLKIAGAPVSIARPRDAIAAGIGLVPEDRQMLALCSHLGVGENTSLASLDRFRRGPLLDLARERAEVARWMESLAVKHRDLDQPVIELSGGNQQKVVVARWLCRETRLLLCDEPTRGVDVVARAELFALLERLAGEGRGVLVISSALPELRALCDRVVVLHRGKLVAELDPEDADDRTLVHLMSMGAT